MRRGLSARESVGASEFKTEITLAFFLPFLINSLNYFESNIE